MGLAAEGDRIGAGPAGQVVLSVPSPEALARDPEVVRQVIDRAPAGTEPLVIAVEDAEVLREEELRPVLEAAGRAHRPVIVRVISAP